MTTNSIGNITEIIELLDKDKYGGEQLAENYAMLIERWGEWEIVGAGNAGLAVRYVDVRNALFSGLMIMYCVFTILSFVCAVLFGKIIFPLLSKHFAECNSEMVDLATLKSASQIDQLSKGKEWF